MIEAQEQLNRLSVADWSQQKPATRSQIHKDLFNKAFRKENKKVTVVTQADLNRVLGLKNV